MTIIKGTTLDNITAAGTNSATATQITRGADWTIVIVTVPSSNNGVILPSNSELGDLIEIHSEPGSAGVTIYPDSGSTFDGSSSALFASTLLLRKTASNVWSAV